MTAGIGVSNWSEPSEPIVANLTSLLTQSYIVQGESFETVRSAVASTGGDIAHELSVFRSVTANFSSDQVAKLHGSAGIKRILGNPAIEVAARGKNKSDGSQPKR